MKACGGSCVLQRPGVSLVAVIKADQPVDGQVPGDGPRFGRAPGAWPLLGHFLALQRHPLRFLDTLADCGDLVEIRLGPRRAYMLCDPALAHRVLTDFRAFDRTGMLYDRIRDAMGNGLAAAAYRDHRRQRLIMQPAFRREHLRGYAAVMQHEIAAAMDGWREGACVDMVEEMFKLTTSVALRALFSSQIDPRDAARLQEAFDVFLRSAYARAALPGISKLPLPGNRRYASALTCWRDQVRALIDGYRRDGAQRDDLMSRLLAARDELGTGMTDEELSDQVAVLLLAGGETTSAALAWSMHLLGEHPQVLGAVRAEADAVLGEDAAGWKHLPHLDLTARVVRESLRMYPPAWIITRTVVRKTQLAQRILPAGSIVLFSPYVLHRRPSLYQRPNDFEPDRWLDREQDGDRSSHAARRGSFLPFGMGATRCIGEEFGTAEATLALASILARWTLTPEAHAAISPAARLVLAPRTLRVRLARRPASVTIGQQ
jgi:cytochrome P450